MGLTVAGDVMWVLWEEGRQRFLLMEALDDFYEESRDGQDSQLGASLLVLLLRERVCHADLVQDGSIDSIKCWF